MPVTGFLTNGLGEAPPGGGSGNIWSRSASDTLRFSDLAYVVQEYLGRFSKGQKVPVSLTLTALPDSAPTMVLSDDPTNTPVATYLLPWKSGTTFGMPLRLSGPAGNTGLGTFRLTISYTINGVAFSAVKKFNLVAGGDPAGETISMFVFERPEMRYLLAQLGSGTLAQGRNPHL